MLLYIILEWRYIEKDQKTIRYIVYIAAACIWCLTACSDLISELWLRWIDSSALILPLFFFVIIYYIYFSLLSPQNPSTLLERVFLCVYTHSRRGYWMLIVDLRSIQSPVYYTQLYKCTHCTDIGLFSFSFPPQYIHRILSSRLGCCCFCLLRVWNSSSLSSTFLSRPLWSAIISLFLRFSIISAGI